MIKLPIISMESTASVETPATISYAKVVAPASASYKTGAVVSAVPPAAAANNLEGLRDRPFTFFSDLYVGSWLQLQAELKTSQEPKIL